MDLKYMLSFLDKHWQYANSDDVRERYYYDGCLEMAQIAVSDGYTGNKYIVISEDGKHSIRTGLSTIYHARVVPAELPGDYTWEEAQYVRDGDFTPWIKNDELRPAKLFNIYDAPPEARVKVDEHHRPVEMWWI